MIERTLKRLLAEIVEKHRKIAFIPGARQVGKTTLARDYLGSFRQSFYFNWDDITDQKRLIRDPYFFEKLDRNPSLPFLVVFDEIHKYKDWKVYLKGAYDKFGSDFRFIVTGSGRLDFFRKGGESLLGRYFSAPLFPLTMGELTGKLPSAKDFFSSINNPETAAPETTQIFEQLMEFSGFPEPFSKADKKFHQMWFQERKTILTREDIRDLTLVKEISQIQLLSHLIPDKVGSPFSINSLRNDVNAAYGTVRSWIAMFEQLCYLFRIQPFTGSLKRSLRKESKVYLYDWSEVDGYGQRFENLVALHLFKAVSLWRAMGEADIGLYYVRDLEKREVDFLLADKKQPLCLIECKSSADEPTPSLTYFQKRLNVPVSVVLIPASNICRKIKAETGVQWTISADRWLSLLP